MGEGVAGNDPTSFLAPPLIHHLGIDPGTFPEHSVSAFRSVNMTLSPAFAPKPGPFPFDWSYKRCLPYRSKVEYLDQLYEFSYS